VKAALYQAAGSIRLGEIPAPQPARGEIQIRVHSCGICGTDIHLFKGMNVGAFSAHQGLVLGHEFGGIVTMVGEDVPAEIAVGNRVVVEPNIGCGKCKTCLAGNYVQCEKGQRIIGIHRDGGFAEYVVAPHEKVFLIPPSVSMTAASVLEPFAICVYGIVRAPLLPGDVVAILGTGVSAHHFTMLAKACGCSKVILAGPNEARLRLGRKLGADVTVNINDKDLVEEVMKETDGRGADYVFEAAGVQQSLGNMVKIAANKARVCMYSVPVERTHNVDFADFLFKDVTFVPAAGAQNTFPRAIRIAASGKVNLEGVITHTFALNEIERALNVVDKRLDGVGKAVIMINPDII
jgi:threonine dehydrogenase-like Zn-dependent dehydrogenase